MCFPQKKEKKIKSNQSHKNRKECHEHCTNFHCNAMLNTKPAFTAFRDKGCMHLHPKFMFMFKCIDFSFRTRGPLKDSTSCFLIRLSPLVLVPIGMFCRTKSPRFYLSQGSKSSPLQDSKSSLLSFVGLKVLTFIFRRTQSLHIYLSQDSKSSPLSFIRLKVLTFVFHRTQSPPSLMLSRQ